MELQCEWCCGTSRFVFLYRRRLLLQEIPHHQECWIGVGDCCDGLKSQTSQCGPSRCIVWKGDESTSFWLFSDVFTHLRNSPSDSMGDHEFFSMFDQIPNSDRSMSRRWMAHGRWIFIPLCLYDQDQWRAINAFDHVWDGCQSCDFHHPHPHPHPHHRRRRRLPFWFKDPIPNSMVQFLAKSSIASQKVNLPLGFWKPGRSVGDSVFGWR